MAGPAIYFLRHTCPVMMRRKGNPHMMEQKGTSLTVCLERYDEDELKALVSLVSSTQPEGKDLLCQLLFNILTDKSLVKRLWNDLDEIQKAAVAEALHSPTLSFEEVRFLARYGKNPDWGKTQPGRRIKEPSRLCLFIHRLEIPSELKNILIGFVAEPKKKTMATFSELPFLSENIPDEYSPVPHNGQSKHTLSPVVSFSTERATLYDILSVMRYIDTIKVPVSVKTGMITKTGLAAIRKVLFCPDYYDIMKLPEKEQERIGAIRSFAWPVMLEAAGFIYMNDNMLRLSEKGRVVLRRSPAAVVKDMFDAWIQNRQCDEFSRIEHIKGHKGKSILTDITERRRIIIDVLKMCPTARWIAVDEFLRFMVAEDCIFYVTDDPRLLYIGDARMGSLGYVDGDVLTIAEKRYLMVFFFEYLATAGCIDVAFRHPAGAQDDYKRIWGAGKLPYLSRYDGLCFFRINNLGAYLFGLRDKYTPTPFHKSDVLRILPTMEIVSVESLPSEDVYLLGLYTEKKSDNVWQISVERIMQAVEDGLSISMFLDYCSARSGGRIPENVRILLDDIDRKKSQLCERESAILFEAATPELAVMIVNHRLLTGKCLKAGEKMIVVPNSMKKVFRKVVHELGYTV
jgi:hypothetical protein